MPDNTHPPQFVQLKQFSVAPLHSDDSLQKYDRLPSEVNRLTNEVVHSPGGCILVTGYRGVGKTTFVNKVLYEADHQLESNHKLITVRLNLARGYSTDKLLRRMIRELFHKANESGVFDELSPSLQRQLTIAFLRTSQQMKYALMAGLKEAVAHTEIDQVKRANTYGFAPQIGIDKLSASLGSMAHHREQSHTTSTVSSREMASERGIEVEFLEYDDEIAENDLNRLIDKLTVANPEPPQAGHSIKKIIKRPHFFWKRLPNQFNLFTWTVKNYREELVPLIIPPKIKLVFILDEIDKMTVPQAKEVFSSLKNLFLKGNVTFILISGKEFYYEWLLNRTTEDDILFSLFTGIFHVPLLSDREFEALVENWLVLPGQAFPPELFDHLLFRAKGTPREFLRTLMRNVEWQENGPIIAMADLRIQLSHRLYPHIQTVYADLADKEKFDPGILDHIRRYLHNWLERMIIFVTFEKEQIFAPPSIITEVPAYEILFSRQLQKTFDIFLKLLIKQGEVEIKYQSDEVVYYTFTQEIRSQLAEIDSSGTGNLASHLELAQKELTEMLAEAQLALDNGEYQEAQELLKSVNISQMEGQEPAEIQHLLKEIRELRERVVNAADNQKLLSVAERHYLSGNYEGAADIYRELRNRQAPINDLDDKYVLSLIQIITEQNTQPLLSQDLPELIHKLEIIVRISQTSTNAEIIEFRRQSKNMRNQYQHGFELGELIGHNLLENNPRQALDTWNKLQQHIPNYQLSQDLNDQLEQLEDDYAELEVAKSLISEDFIQASKLLRKLSNSQDRLLAVEADFLNSQVDELRRMLRHAEKSLLLGDREAFELADSIERIAQKLPGDLPQLNEFRKHIQVEERITKLENEILTEIKAGRLEIAWDTSDILQAMGEQSESARKSYKRVRHDLDRETLSLASELASNIYAVFTIEEGIAVRPIAHKAQYSEINSGNPIGALNDITEILQPLLKRDPDNIRAKTLLESVKRKIESIE